MYKISKHLAWLSIWRRKTRSLMVIIMIALSLSGLLGLQGLYDGMITHMINTTIRSDSGEISLYAKEYRMHKSFDYRLNSISQFEGKLSQIIGLNAYAIRFKAGPQWEFLTGSLDDSVSVQKAFDADRGDKMNHSPMTLMRATRNSKWIRYEGFATADELTKEARNML